jgi:integrase
MKRHGTKYPGVFYREVDRLGGAGKERMFYIRFPRNGEKVEEKVGRQYADRMNAAKAARIRSDRIEGRLQSRKEIREAEAAKCARWTIDRLWTAYRESLESNPDKSRKAVSVDGNRYENFLKDRLGKKEPHEVQHLDIERLRRELQKTPAKIKGHPESTKPLSPATIRAVLTVLKRICNYGSKNGLCSGLSAKIQMPKVSNQGNENLTDEETQRLLAAIAADTNADARGIMLLALFSGMRKSEIFRLKWADIDFERNFIHLRKTKSGKKKEIPLNSQARAVLEAHPRTSEFVFPGEEGGQRVTIQVALRRIRTAAGLPADFRPLHGLRHSFASRLVSAGVDLFTVSRLLTHASTTMTARYAHLSPGALRKASELAGALVDQAKAKEKTPAAVEVS